jgi:hypothetical protein
MWTGLYSTKTSVNGPIASSRAEREQGASIGGLTAYCKCALAEISRRSLYKGPFHSIFCMKKYQNFKYGDFYKGKVVPVCYAMKAYGGVDI